MPDREEKIRARAYALWERDGYSHGSHERHWAEAERQIDAEEAQGAASSTGPAQPSGGSASEAPNIEAPAKPMATKRRPKGEAAAMPAAARKSRPKAAGST